MSESQNLTGLLHSEQAIAARLAAKREARQAEEASETAEAAPEEEDAPEQETLDLEGDDETDDIQSAEGADIEPESDDDSPAIDDDEEEVEPEEAHAIAPPQSWTGDRKAEFESAPDSLKEIILEREKEVQTALSDKGREAAEAKRNAEEAANRFKTEKEERVQKMDDFLAQSQPWLNARYSGIDVNELQRNARDGDEQAERVLAQIQQDLAILQNIEAQRKKEADDLLKAAKESEPKTIKDRNPEYRGDGGEERYEADRKRVDAVAIELGIDKDGVDALPADHFELIRDALNWRAAQKEAKEKPKPKKRPAQKTAKPSARQKPDHSKKALAQARKNVQAASKRGINATDQAVADLLALKRQQRQKA